MRALVCLTWFLSLVGAASARPPSPRATEAPVHERVADRVAKLVETVPEVGPVHGRVVTSWGLGMARRRVSLGGKRTYTDREGRFTFETVPATYDVTITERDNRQATAYHGLTRRDPVLVHLPTQDLARGFRSPDKPAPDSGRIAGTVELLKARPATSSNTRRDAESLTFSYLAPNYYPALNPGAIYLGSCATSGTYDCELPDLTALGGEYCIAVGESLSNLRAMRCGGKIGMKDFSIPAHTPAPQIKVEDDGHSDRMITWTTPRGLDARVYELNLGSEFERLNVRVYTSAQTFTWSQVEALGVDFRRDGPRFTWSQVEAPGVDFRRDPRLSGIKVTALLPYTSMDDLVSGRGPMAVGSSWRRVESDEVVLTLPAGFKAALPPARPGKFDPRDSRSVPACPSPDTVKSLAVGELRPGMANTWVTVRGPLGFAARSCIVADEGGGSNRCGANWLVIDVRNPSTGVLLQRAEDSELLDAGYATKPPEFEVMATGLLVVRPDYSSLARQPRYILDQVGVCAILPLRKP